jgi:hypothetical protein
MTHVSCIRKLRTNPMHQNEMDSLYNATTKQTAPGANPYSQWQHAIVKCNRNKILKRLFRGVELETHIHNGNEPTIN